MFIFFNIVKVEGGKETVTKKIISDGKETNENTNDIETEYASTEDSLSLHRAVSNEITFVFKHGQTSKCCHCIRARYSTNYNFK